MEKRKFRLQYATLVLCVTSTYVNYALAYCVTCNKCVWKWKQGGSDVRPRAGRQEFESSSGFFLAPSLYLDRFLSATCPVASDYRDWRPEREPGVCFVQCWYADNYACYLTSLSRVMFVWCINVEWNGYPLFQKDNSSWGMTGIGQRDCAPPPLPALVLFVWWRVLLLFLDLPPGCPRFCGIWGEQKTGKCQIVFSYYCAGRLVFVYGTTVG